MYELPYCNCSPLHFRDSTRHPELWFTTLRNARFDEETLIYGKYFTECEALIGDRRYMVYAPTIYDATRMAKLSMLIFEECSSRISTIKYLRREIVVDPKYDIYTDVFLEEIPAGRPLSEAIYTSTQRHLLRGMRAFRRRLKENNIVLNNVDIDNIIVDESYEWHAIRCLYATYGQRRDDAAFRLIKDNIMEYSLTELPSDSSALDATRREYPGIKLPLCERRRRVVTKEGVGFVDERDTIVIPVQYLTATDFYENRSIVTTKAGGVGIIDRDGRYIIAPEYDRIEFDHEDGDSKAYRGDNVTLYDYNGRIKG